ncbi:MAG: hypothetical protein LC737_02795 [Chloroflexi bacterium]|nr:hypothetical protein [Chloroflexota bacterium]
MLPNAKFLWLMVPLLIAMVLLVAGIGVFRQSRSASPSRAIASSTSTARIA